MRATGITSYYNRVQPANPAARLRQVERDEPESHTDIASVETQEQKQEDLSPRWFSLEGQALLCLAIILLILNIINQGLKWLCG